MEKEDIERIEKIEGQIAAIGMTLHALICDLPNNTGLLATIHERSEQMQSRLLPSHAPDKVLEGAQGWIHQWIVKPQQS